MKSLKTSTQYRKDLKRYRNKPQKLEALRKVLELLINEQPIPQEYYPHMLQGEYKGCMECHIQSDFLHIWIAATRASSFASLNPYSDSFSRSFRLSTKPYRCKI